ncbi:MAG: ornithine--oxo-acid transaminase [Oligoflexia bacterium]|nr:ornithine--oxo-acid transaminase [Oligoflexia bacterium]
MSSKSKKLIETMEKCSAHNYKPLPIVLEKGKGCWVWDVDGKKYLDMLSSYSAVNHGHRHPKIIAAARQQLNKLTLVSRAFHSELLCEFCKKVTRLAGYDMFLPMNSGAEAVETAVKLIRKWAYSVKKIQKHNAEIIVCRDNFHGRTITVVSFSSEHDYKDNFGPFTPGFKIIPYGDIEALKNAITPNTAAFMVEPIQGEAGILMPEKGFMEEAQKVCRENNILFALDEIQTGFGRTGKLFCHYWEKGVRPDMLIVGKALGGGIVPISGVLADEPVMSLFTPGEHGSTFGGNPFACACANAAMDVLVKEKLSDKSLKMGEYMQNKIRKSVKSKYIKNIRGKGLFIGIELAPEAGGARKYCEALMEKGMLCKETHENVIRLAPPLVITKKEIDWAVEKLKEVLND